MAIHTPMTFLRAMFIVAVTTVAFTAVGAGIGAALGYFNPDYYRAVLPKSADMDQVSVGLGLGLTQGLAAGLLIGLAIVGVLTWQHVRLSGRRT
ncbi:MAG: hypothetical protein IPK87_14000 [Planctomycetes bacterium]|nr:hypothetical protein [Planctomycetota bacterium]